MRVVNTLLVLACFAVIASVVVADGEGPGDASGTAQAAVAKKKPRTLYQACRKELTRMCKGERYMMKCLLGNQTNVQDALCTSWLGARKSCEKDVESCKDALRVCVAKAEASTLSAECSESDFYKSIKRAAALRKRGLHGKGERLVTKDLAKGSETTTK